MPGVKQKTLIKLATIGVIAAVFVWYLIRALQPPLPVTVRFRSDMSGSGFVLIFENQSDRALSFSATLEHPKQHEEKKFDIHVQPHGTYELGRRQGWIGQSGDRISLVSPDHSTWTGSIP